MKVLKEKVIGFLIGAIIIFVISGLLYVAIKYPRAYPGYDLAPPPIYSPWPATQSSSCIKNPEWCYLVLT